MIQTNNFGTNKYLDEAKELLSSIKDISFEDVKKTSCTLASLLMKSSISIQSNNDTKKYFFLKNSLENLNSKAFIFESLDLAIRSKDEMRLAKQFLQIIDKYGIPKYLSFANKFYLQLFSNFGKHLPHKLVPLLQKKIFKNYEHLILYREKRNFEHYLEKKKKENLDLNISYMSEEASSEKEAKENLNAYLSFLDNPEIDYISVKLSSICPSMKNVAMEYSIEKASENLRPIYRKALEKSKFVALDMETYDYFPIIINTFKRVLEEKEFEQFYAGITLQAYLPNSYSMQNHLTKWSLERVKKGRAPIQINLCRGAYLSYEQVASSIHGWPQATYLNKICTDANFRRMIFFGLTPQNLKGAHIGICTHNLFDIAYALVLRESYSIHPFVSFHLLEGRTLHIRKTLKLLLEDKLRIYTPICDSDKKDKSIYYIQRRLEELVGAESFLKLLYHSYQDWESFESNFLLSFDQVSSISTSTRRSFWKKSVPLSVGVYEAFENEPNTDFTLPSKQKWQEKILKNCLHYKFKKIPLCIGGNEIFSKDCMTNYLTSTSSHYSYCIASKELIELSICTAKENEKSWEQFPLDSKKEIIAKAASLYREKRASLIEAIMLDNCKILIDADSEISHSIDIMEYYIARLTKLKKMEDLSFSPKGTIYIASARSFPFSSALGGIIAALITGNCVIFKPPPNAVLSGWFLVSLLWEAGIPKNVLQFVNCSDKTTDETYLIDKRISSIILTGKSSTLQRFLQKNPLMDICSSSEGKNIMIISAISDKALAIKNLLQSAFSFSGQKYSCVSLAILEQEIYSDKKFLQDLVECAKNLKVGSIFDSHTEIGPLMQPLDDELLRALTTLEEGEEWLLKPIQDPKNPLLWSAGIKIGVTTKSSLYNKFLPLPLLGLMRAENLQDAIHMANNEWGLCASLQSLDKEEQKIWQTKIEAGNLYINTITTKAVIKRQPFGGCKKSSFGKGFKAGGPNYLLQCVRVHQSFLPKDERAVNKKVQILTDILKKFHRSEEEMNIWFASIANYSYWWHKMSTFRDPMKIIGQDNFFGYVPLKSLTLRITENCSYVDILRICAAALTAELPLTISYDKTKTPQWTDLNALFAMIDEDEAQLIQRIFTNKISRLRMATKPSEQLKREASLATCFIDDSSVLANGRIEMLNYCREITISTDYHRYGNLGTREGELRKPPI